MPRTAHRLLAFTFASLAAIGFARGQEPENVYTTDEQGRRFRVRFDPGSRLTLGLFSSVSGDAQEWELSLGLSVRRVYEWMQDDDRLRWQLDHRFLDGRIRPQVSGPEPMPELEAVAYQGSYLRHTEYPYLTLPTDPPKRMYFPFDIGLRAEAGRLELGRDNESRDLIRLGIIRAAVLLDPWRSGREGNSLEIGLGLRYHLDIQGDPDLSQPTVNHRVSPFTDCSIRFRYQDRQGLTVLDLEAHLIPHWASRGGWTTGLEGRASIERVLIAVNDEPVSLVLAADYLKMDSQTPPEARLTAGLLLGFQL